MQAVRNDSEEQRMQAIEEGREELEEKRTLWYEIAEALDKTVLFIRPQKGDGTRAWDVLCRRFKSFDTSAT